LQTERDNGADVVIYKTPKDVAAFTRHYFETHIPLAKKLPGLRKYEVSQDSVLTPHGASEFHFVATCILTTSPLSSTHSPLPKGSSAPRTVRTWRQTRRISSCCCLTIARYRKLGLRLRHPRPREDRAHPRITQVEATPDE
jgi:uncharacterized protein (TIGR02118 family)